MNRQRFEEQNEEDWDELQHFVDEMDSGRLPANPERLPVIFRKVCGDLSLAQHRMYGMDLTERLNHAVIRGYNHLYAGLGGGLSSALRWAAVDFPGAIRRDWRLFWLCFALFWVPFVSMIVASYYKQEWIEALVSAESMVQLETGFGPGSELSEYRDHFGSNFMMFALYVWNNIGWDFRVFAGGVFCCIGAIFYNFYFGLVIGASAGYVHMLHDGNFPEPFYAFVSGHSAPELLAVSISGVAGMRLGLAVLSPGRLTRGKALAAEGKKVLPIICGAAMMTFMAALIEGFWSANDAEPKLKYIVGISLWVLFACYFLFCGRRSAHAA